MNTKPTRGERMILATLEALSGLMLLGIAFLVVVTMWNLASALKTWFSY